MSPLRLMLLATSVGALVATGARAADAPCRADAQKFCAGAPAAGGKLVGCLQAHDADLSKPCKAKLEEIKSRTGPLLPTCRYDIAHFCAHVSRGGGRVASCLETHRDELTPECRDRLGQLPPP